MKKLIRRLGETMKRAAYITLLLCACALCVFIGAYSNKVAYKLKDSLLKHEYEKKSKLLEQKTEEAERFTFLQKKRMHELYPDLNKYKIGENIVSKKYVDSFTVSTSTEYARSIEHDSRTVTIKLKNTKGIAIRPKFVIYFFDQYGYVLDKIRVDWLIDKIQPEELRTEKGTVRSAGITYYKVDFLE